MTIENHIQVLDDFKKELQSQRLQIDHLYEDVHNNCKSNLSLVNIEKHRGKRAIERHLKFFSNLIEAYDGGRYRIQYAFISSIPNKKIRILRYYCDRIEDVNNFRKYISAKVHGRKGHNQWLIRNKHKGDLSTDGTYSIAGNPSFLCGDQKLVLQGAVCDLQKYITEELPIEKFTKWKAGMNLCSDFLATE